MVLNVKLFGGIWDGLEKETADYMPVIEMPERQGGGEDCPRIEYVFNGTHPSGAYLMYTLMPSSN